ncbi:DNA cytosine methyltransferase [Candidatus Palauibacter sp.]|uniref:DNA cytosine methyltransferase n=1 Tax=Candidatus Palauibacter sp. TaxID=3101350 RepID=UPI003B01ED69
MHQFYDFFAGGGMALAGLGDHWECLYANDIDENKARCYAKNWGDAHLRVGDIADVEPSQLPGRPDLAWASFPCQDLSLAGSGEGLGGARSGTFWPFWRLMEALRAERRPPRLVVLENVCGAITSHGGKDLTEIVRAICDGGYVVGALVIDAEHFVPQSRKRLFIIGLQQTVKVPVETMKNSPTDLWHPPALVKAHGKLPDALRKKWIWWNMAPPPPRRSILADIVETDATGVRWHTEQETARLLEMMTPSNRQKMDLARSLGRPVVGTVYRRTRPDGCGGRRQRAEVRFDGVAGCLRTPRGGSSRQTIMIVDGKSVRTRLLSAREAARLMGLPDEYWLPDNYNQAYHVSGDGLVVPVVRHLTEQILAPLVDSEELKAAAA